MDTLMILSTYFGVGFIHFYVFNEASKHIERYHIVPAIIFGLILWPATFLGFVFVKIYQD